ncbi:MAG: BMP family ABC transporter substrate-binding protein [Lachnospiraceae bacterium]|nr:BMP family ABC transporter substrate-binding protein [Lachnospiraceae bacterium]
MLEDYNKARKLGKKEYNKAVAEGRYPYLTALDDLISESDTRGSYPVGYLEIPLDMIAGTKTAGRQKAFADNFMPLLEPHSEFAMKWSSLYDSQMEEGIRDPIKVYEYMHRFYVQEGNKRVSVSRVVDAVTILAEVNRIVPEPREDDDYLLYKEFLDFYNVAPIYEIDFSRVGSYKKLADLMQMDFEHPWPLDLLQRLKGGFQYFDKNFREKFAEKLRINSSDAFLIYLNFYHLDEMQGLPESVLISRISKLWNEFLIQSNEDEVTVIDRPEEGGFSFRTQSVIRSIFGGSSGYSKEKPLKVAFCYERPQETSTWIYGHELGRNFVENKYEGTVTTLCYDHCGSEDELRTAIDDAVSKECELIFTVSPKQMTETLRSAVHYPKVKFFNCSINLSHSRVRTYYARMFEAKAIIGALAASLSSNHKIGYLADYPIYGSLAEVNAYAIGAAMVDPKVRVYLSWTSMKDGSWREVMEKNGVELVSGKDFIRPENASREYGLFRLDDNGGVRNLAAPVWNWGKFYELIIDACMAGHLDQDPGGQAINYWWGMSAGVVDIITSEHLPYESKKLVENLKLATMNGSINPFRGELRSQNGRIQKAGGHSLSEQDIITMNWLNDNIVGRLPRLEELTQAGKDTVAVSGIIKEDDTIA